MKSWGGLIAAVIMVHAMPPSAEACDHFFTLYNGTPWERFCSVYTREYGEFGWSYEHLGRATVLPSGYHVDSNFRNTDTIRFDIELVFDGAIRPTCHQYPYVLYCQ